MINKTKMTSKSNSYDRLIYISCLKVELIEDLSADTFYLDKSTFLKVSVLTEEN